MFQSSGIFKIHMFYRNMVQFENLWGLTCCLNAYFSLQPESPHRLCAVFEGHNGIQLLTGWDTLCTLYVSVSEGSQGKWPFMGHGTSDFLSEIKTFLAEFPEILHQNPFDAMGSLSSQFARIKFNWHCCIYCMTQWQKLILLYMYIVVTKIITRLASLLLDISEALDILWFNVSKYMVETWQGQISSTIRYINPDDLYNAQTCQIHDFLKW